MGGYYLGSAIENFSVRLLEIHVSIDAFASFFVTKKGPRPYGNNLLKNSSKFFAYSGL